MSPPRARAKPVFDPNALDADIDDLWPARKSSPTTATAPPAPTPRLTTPPPVAASTSAVVETPHAPSPAPTQTPPPTPTLTPQAQPAPASAPSTADKIQPAQPRRIDEATPGAVAKRPRPPEVLLSAEVYDELYRTQIAEKKVRRGLARTMGAIVLDAIETHAAKLATTWTSQQYAVGEGQLFERPSSNAVPRRRRHATAPRTVVLSGVTAANSQRLDNLVQAWGAGTRSALVEQALRYEFNLLPG